MRQGLCYWRMSRGIILPSIVGMYELVKESLSRDRHGTTANAVVCRQRRPFGAVAFAWSDKGPWICISVNAGNVAT